MRTAFFGTSAFAVPPLHAFAAATDCRLVITQPDRPAGRGQQLRETPVKQAARELGIPTIGPERMRDALPALAAEKFDLFAVASYGKIVPQAILDLPRLGALNVHPSLLPLYRGATPLQSQIRDGVAESGVTIILMDAGMDTGDIVVQERSTIGESETYGELHDRFASLGARLLARAVEQIHANSLVRTPQYSAALEDEAIATLTRPLTKDDLRFDKLPSGRTGMRAIVNHVRSLSPAPGARGPVLIWPQEMTKVLAAHALEQGPDIRDIPVFTTAAIDGWLLIKASDGWVAVDELLAPGRRAMTIREFRNNCRNTGPELWATPLQEWYVKNNAVLTAKVAKSA